MQELVEKVDAADGGQRLDAFWQGCLDGEGVTRGRIQTWIQDGRARINGRVCTKSSTRIMPGQILSLAPEFPDSDLTPCEGALRVLFSDDSLVVLDKEPGLTVHPAPSVSEPTLVHRAAHHFPVLLSQSGERPGVVHRLDKDTSGLIVLALSETARLALAQSFASRAVHKEYLALVAGVPPLSGTVTLPLGRHPTIKTRMAVVPRGGRAAETRYSLLWSAKDKSASLIRVRILTGRTHQIRVHMAALGHPLLGDAVYADMATATRAPRQMLHSWRLKFEHPVSQDEASFTVSPPDDFLKVLHELSREQISIGLTGVVGSGKSTVANAVAELGVPVFSADRIVAASYARGGEGAVVLDHHFASRFASPDGGVDKNLLRVAMEESPSLRREVERLIHPLVRRALTEFRACHADEVILAEIPLLCEAGLAGEIDLVAVVFCPDDSRHARLAGRGWSLERIAQFDSWQWSQDRKVRAAQLLIDNSGSLADLQYRAASMLRIVQTMVRTQHERGMTNLRTLFEHPETLAEMD